MHLIQIRASAAHGLFHAMQRVDTLLRELELLDLHGISVRVVNQCFTHGQGLNVQCQVDEVERAIRDILAQLPGRVKGLPQLSPWQEQYREGLVMELVGQLHQALGLVSAYRNLPEALASDTLLILEITEGVVGTEEWFGLIERACDWEPGNGPWG